MAQSVVDSSELLEASPEDGLETAGVLRSFSFNDQRFEVGTVALMKNP